MSDIRVKPLGGERYRVEVADGRGRSAHEVRVTADDLRRYGREGNAEELLEASFKFLLDREPKEAILGRFDLPVIERYFPEYPLQIGKYLVRLGQ